MEVVLSKEISERLGSQSPLLTSYRLKSYHKGGLNNKLNFGHWSRHCDTQRERRRTPTMIQSMPLSPHMHGAIYKERGPMTARVKEIKNKEEIFQLLEAIWELSHWLLQ
jgi:hypothetical protein